MSSGKIHTLASVALATGFTVAALSTYDMDSMQYAAGAVVGIFIQPDCDVDKGFIAYSYIRKRLGDWAEFIWDRIWYMYRRSVKHGSELSHFPVISTLGRLAYFFLFCVVIPNFVLSFFGLNFSEEVAWWFGKVIEYWRVIIGLMGADFIHFILDISTVQGKFSLSSLLSLTPVPERKQ